MKPGDDETFDYIVVGAGASGCVVAGGLASRPGTRVAVLEAGRAKGLKITAIPAATLFTNGNAAFDWRFVSQPDPTRHDRVEVWPRGLGPGGSTRINGMSFARGARRGHDTWRSPGARGWGYSDVLPYFRRIERSPFEASQERGSTGPLSVSNLPYAHALTPPFMRAAHEPGPAANTDHKRAAQAGVGPLHA